MSSETYRLTNLSIEGFRGINKRINLDLDGFSTVICGANGFGKTSILQAVEWGLFGWIPHMSGAEFDFEDAIVNQFHPTETAKVELTLESSENKVRIVRTRKKSHWSRRKSKLIVETNGTTLKGKAAQAKIQSLLDLTEDEFYASKYLHQEALREFIMGDLKTRSAVMDRLLGTYSLRELIDSLPITQVTRRIKEIGEQIQTLRSTELRSLPVARAKLQDTKNRLLQEGITEDDLNIRPLPSLFQELAKKVESLAEEIDVYVSHLEMPPQNLAALQEAISRLRNNISTLEREKFKKYRELGDKKVTLTSLRDQYKNILERQRSLQIKDQEALKRKINDIEDQIRRNEARRQETRDLRNFLQAEAITLTNLEQNFLDLQEAKRKITSEYGDIDSVKEQIAQLEREINGLKGKIGGLETYSQTIASALEFIKEQGPDTCPICKRTIDPLEIADHLQKEIAQAKTSAQIFELRQTVKKLENKVNNLQKIRGELDDLEGRLGRATAALDEQRKKIAERTEMTEINRETVNERLRKTESELKELESSMDRLITEKHQLENDLSNLNEIERSIADLTQIIHAEIGIEEKGIDLLQALSTVLEKTEAKVESFDAITSSLEKLNRDVRRFEGIVNYLTQEAEVLRLEQEFPEIEALMRELTDKHQRLKELERGLADIKQAASAEQKNLVSDMLEEIESEINRYYSRLMGHTYYVDLGLSIETRRGRNIYWIKARGAEHETHVRTRFSNAQLNTTAIAVFISMSKRLSQNLNLVILDDPTQSMDQLHKKAMANILAEQSKDKQVIIATQDQEFQEQLVRLIQPNKHLKIIDWNIRGPTISY
jgi:exonuclease SbcC